MAVSSRTRNSEDRVITRSSPEQNPAGRGKVLRRTTFATHEITPAQRTVTVIWGITVR